MVIFIGRYCERSDVSFGRLWRQSQITTYSICLLTLRTKASPRRQQSILAGVICAYSASLDIFFVVRDILKLSVHITLSLVIKVR